MKVTSVILCGGRERRFGRSKAMATVGGRAIIERVIERLEPISNQILVVTSPDKANLAVRRPAEVLTDRYPDRGPLGGIYTGLISAKHGSVVVVGCDMPFLNSELLHHMVAISEGFDAVIPRLERGMVEPLHAVYSSTCAPAMKTRLDRNELAINRLLNDLNVRYLDKEEYLPLDPRMTSFFNINYPEDLDRANELARDIDALLDPLRSSTAPSRSMHSVPSQQGLSKP